MNEFDLIKKYFAPLASGFPGSLNLTDDAALIDVPEGMQLVATKDAIVEGVHFIGNESPALIARKLLRTNLSDLAAKGATPLCYLMAGMLPKTITSEWLESFASGLAMDQALFNIRLAGGDTTVSPGGVCLTLTALGLVPHGGMLKRSGAKVGDDIYVSGTLGDSALGLQLLSSPWKGEDQGGGRFHRAIDPLPNPPPSKGREYLIQRYLLPEPRLSLGIQLRGIASSCMDISDGLVQDLGHICAASGVGAVIHSDALPLSDTAKTHANALLAALSGGDDYELLFTAPKEKAPALAALEVTRIGEITAGAGVIVLDGEGKEMVLEHKGFSHF